MALPIISSINLYLSFFIFVRLIYFTLDSFDSIEQFTLQIRREMFPTIQKELLKDAQKAHKKKGSKE